MRQSKSGRKKSQYKVCYSGCRCEHRELLPRCFKSMLFRAALALGLSIKGLGAGNGKMQMPAAYLRRGGFGEIGFSSHGTVLCRYN